MNNTEKQLDCILEKVRDGSINPIYVEGVDANIDKFHNLQIEVFHVNINELTSSDKYTRKYQQLMDFLVLEDKLIKLIENNYFLTIKGELFEGYVKQKEINAMEANKVKTIANVTLILTAILAFRTMALVFVELLKWYSGD